MEVSSIIDKLTTFFGVLFSSPFTIIPTILIALFVYELFFRMKREDIYLKQFFILGIVACILFTVITYFTNVLAGLDAIVTGILTEYYFPSMMIYMGIVVGAHVIALVSMLKDSISTLVKKVNVIMFTSIEVLFFEFLYLLGKYHLSLTTINQLHSNKEILTILETTTFITFVWILMGSGFQIVRHFGEEREKKMEESTYPQVSISQFTGVPLFPQEKVIVQEESKIQKEDLIHLQELYREEQTLIKEQLKLMSLVQEKSHEKLATELPKLVNYSRRRSLLKEQVEAYDILLHNEKVTMEEEIDLLTFIIEKEHQKIENEIDNLLRKLSNENFEK